MKDKFKLLNRAILFKEISAVGVLASLALALNPLTQVPLINVDIPSAVTTVGWFLMSSSGLTSMFFSAKVSDIQHEIKNEYNQLKKNPKSKAPRKVKLVYQSKTRSKTKNLMDKQVLKSLEEFNKRISHYKQWLNNNRKYYIKHPTAIRPTIESLGKNDLLALRQVVTEHPSDETCTLFASEIKNTLNRNGHEYVLRTSKH